MNRNYSWAILVFVVILATAFYFISGKKVFKEQLKRHDEAARRHPGHSGFTGNETHKSSKGHSDVYVREESP